MGHHRRDFPRTHVRHQRNQPHHLQRHDRCRSCHQVLAHTNKRQTCPRTPLHTKKTHRRRSRYRHRHRTTMPHRMLHPAQSSTRRPYHLYPLFRPRNLRRQQHWPTPNSSPSMVLLPTNAHVHPIRPWTLVERRHDTRPRSHRIRHRIQPPRLPTHHRRPATNLPTSTRRNTPHDSLSRHLYALNVARLFCYSLQNALVPTRFSPRTHHYGRIRHRPPLPASRKKHLHASRT